MKLSMKAPSFHQHNYFHGIIIICAFAFLLFSCHQSSNSGKRATSFQYIHEVNPMIGTGARGMIVPAALVPFGMVQLGPDTRHWGSGYHYQDDSIQGFSHVHKSGAGCGDFLDILFQPVSEPVRLKKGLKKEYASSFSHAKEKATVGLYQVHLDNFEIDVALTATKRCGFHQYTYSGNSQPGVVIDLKHGNVGACTIIKEDGYDTVMTSYLEIIDPHTIQGYKISSGWAEEQHVYFYTKFSRPIAAYQFSDAGEAFDGKILESTDIKALLNFTLDDPERTLLVKTGISSVSMESARKNLEAEIKDWDFDHVVQKAQMAWENQLSKIGIKGGTKDQRTSFYTALYHAFTYPMLYSDVEGYYRGGDFNVHKTKGHDNYNGVMSLWDTFRGAMPLINWLKPSIGLDYIKTFDNHYQQTGLLPVWVLAGDETLVMLGYHSMPVIADAYAMGIRDFDENKIFDAMKASAQKDTFGTWMRRYVGLKNYKEYDYVPADKELTSVSKTLEYAYDDYTIAQMAKMLGRNSDYDYYINRAKNYQHLFDPESGFMRGKLADGNWRTPFNPLGNNHFRDDYAEGTAWQWSFFVPHDVKGLAELYGGNQALAQKLDSLFIAPEKVEGENPSGDIDGGKIGQYVHGNEPSHHIIYMYNYIGEPFKTQKRVKEIREKFYFNDPEGYSGNEDTGQMASWLVWSSLGFYPVTHGNGIYPLGAPAFKEIEVDIPGGKVLLIKAIDLSEENIYVESVKVNGEQYPHNYITNDLLLNGGEIIFYMTDQPTDWGTAKSNTPPSLQDELPELR